MPGVYIMKGRFADDIIDGIDDERFSIGWGINHDVLGRAMNTEKAESIEAEDERENEVN